MTKFIQSTTELREMYGDHHPHTPYKVQNHLTEQALNFVRRSPFALLSTIGPDGETTISPKGGAPGFVGIGDNKTLYMPDLKGNNLIFSLQNIVQNPQIGLLFLVPGTGETLRVHGRAYLTADEALCQTYPVGNRPALLVAKIEMDSAYFHCSKSLATSKIWDPESWTDKIKISFKDEIVPNLPASEM